MGVDRCEIDAVLTSYGLVAFAASVMYKERPISLVVSKGSATLDLKRAPCILWHQVEQCSPRRIIQARMPRKPKLHFGHSAMLEGQGLLCMFASSWRTRRPWSELEVVDGLHVPLRPLPRCLETLLMTNESNKSSENFLGRVNSYTQVTCNVRARLCVGRCAFSDTCEW